MRHKNRLKYYSWNWKDYTLVLKIEDWAAKLDHKKNKA